MTYKEERDSLARFKFAIASNNIKNLVKSLDETEINFLISTVNELGYDSSIITSNIEKKEVVVEEKIIPNALEEYIRLRSSRSFM